ncbi:sensor domain-containing protein [Streptomyces axinellae]|uniref:histidine kinase n=2 Tax=Streptomyces axinellae TaxID=552788 RepID=A0ABN3PUU6_9ACTN
MARSDGAARAARAAPAALRPDRQADGRAGPGSRGGRLRSAGLAASRGVVLAFLSLAGSLTLFIITVVSLALLLTGVGFLTTPWVLHAVRTHADQRRVLAGDWAGTRLLAPYRPLPRTRGGVTGHIECCLLMLKDPATWRDLIWLIVDATVGFALALLPPALITYGVEGWVVLCGLWRAVAGDYWYGFVHVENVGDAVQCALLGTLLLLLALNAGQHLVKAHFQVARAFLSPTREALLAQRVERLYETRHDAVGTSAAELRRIERDLHDGAQARLVAMGMSLGTIEALVEHDPAKAKQLIAQARESSAEALTELRDLVRGIHPPVLAERGLGDAAKALALRMRVPVEVDIDLPGRFDEPVETAAYFATSEILTNAAKHAEADRIWLDIGHTYDAGGMLRITVTDDGKGGADLTKGSGIAGIERRLGQFDGVLALTSPPGGPTMVTMEIPGLPVSW